MQNVSPVMGSCSSRPGGHGTWGVSSTASSILGGSTTTTPAGDRILVSPSTVLVLGQVSSLAFKSLASASSYRGMLILNSTDGAAAATRAWAAAIVGESCPPVGIISTEISLSSRIASLSLLRNSTHDHI